MKTESICEGRIVVRAPNRLIEILDAEAEHRMISKSALVRLAIQRELGLLESKRQDLEAWETLVERIT